MKLNPYEKTHVAGFFYFWLIHTWRACYQNMVHLGSLGLWECKSPRGGLSDLCQARLKVNEGWYTIDSLTVEIAYDFLTSWNCPPKQLRVFTYLYNSYEDIKHNRWSQIQLSGWKTLLRSVCCRADWEVQTNQPFQLIRLFFVHWRWWISWCLGWWFRTCCFFCVVTPT